jgi:hypothetical protein
MTGEPLTILRANADPEEPWTAPEGCTPVRLRSATDGGPPLLATSVTLWYDREALSVLFSGADDLTVASHVMRDAPLYEEDVVEVFLAPESLQRYFEIEISPNGSIFDATVDSPEGDRRSMTVDRGWTCEGLFAAVRKTSVAGDITLDVIVRIPFASIGRPTPSPGEQWRANFFRIDRHPERGGEFLAWQPTLRTPPDFHVPAKFGTLRFAG